MHTFLSRLFHPFCYLCSFFFFFSSRRRHTRSLCDWSSDVCSSDLMEVTNRAWMAEKFSYDDHLAPDGRVMEMLSEHQRSEERRVGKECRARWGMYRQKRQTD